MVVLHKILPTYYYLFRPRIQVGSLWQEMDLEEVDACDGEAKAFNWCHQSGLGPHVEGR